MSRPLRVLQGLFRGWLALYAQSLRGLPRATWRLAGATLVQRACTMAIAFSTLYLTERLGFSIPDAAALLALFGAGGVFGSLAGGVWTERFGSLTVQVVSLIATAMGFLVYGLFETFVDVAIVLAALGFSTGAYRPAASTMLTATVPDSSRAQAFAFYRLAINLGMAVGPAVGGFLAEWDFHLIFWVDGAGCILTAVLSLVWLRNIMVPGQPSRSRSTGRRSSRRRSSRHEAASTTENSRPHDVDTEHRSPWTDGPVLVLVASTAITATVVMQWYFVGTVYFIEEYGMTKSELGLVLAVNPIVIVLLEMVIVQRLRDQPPLGWIAMAVGLVALSTFLVPFGSTIPWAVFALLLWTAGEMIESPLAGAFVATRAGPRNMGRYMGLYTASWSVSAVLAPWLGGLLYADFGGMTLWCTFGAGAAVCATTLWILARRTTR